jgi:NADPH-dependent curcumin reductase CurA
MQLELHHGIANALDVFNLLFEGGNQGKLVLQVSEPSIPM